MKKKKAKEILQRVQEKGYSRNPDTGAIIYKQIEEDLESDIEDIEKESKELIGRIEDITFSLNLALQ